MSRVLTEVDSFDSDITVPENGDSGTAESIVGAVQSLANRTNHLGIRVNNGVRKVRIAADFSEMVGLVAELGEICSIEGHGFYQLTDYGGTPAADDYVIFDSTGVPGAKWIWTELYRTRDATGGIAALGPSILYPDTSLGKIAIEQAPWSVVFFGSLQTASRVNDTILAGADRDVSNSTILVPVVEGDAIEGEYVVLIHNKAADDPCKITLTLTDPDSGHSLAFDFGYISGSVFAPFTIPFYRTGIVGTGNEVISLKVQASATGSVTVVGMNDSLYVGKVKVLRP
jgi:hypothetical protein